MIGCFQPILWSPATPACWGCWWQSSVWVIPPLLPHQHLSSHLSCTRMIYYWYKVTSTNQSQLIIIKIWPITAQYNKIWPITTQYFQDLTNHSSVSYLIDQSQLSISKIWPVTDQYLLYISVCCRSQFSRSAAAECWGAAECSECCRISRSGTWSLLALQNSVSHCCGSSSPGSQCHWSQVCNGKGHSFWAADYFTKS